MRGSEGERSRAKTRGDVATGELHIKNESRCVPLGRRVLATKLFSICSGVRGSNINCCFQSALQRRSSERVPSPPSSVCRGNCFHRGEKVSLPGGRRIVGFRDANRPRTALRGNWDASATRAPRNWLINPRRKLISMRPTRGPDRQTILNRGPAIRLYRSLSFAVASLVPLITLISRREK